MSVGAMIYTGIDRGSVNVRVEVYDSVPDIDDPEQWDDIVEATVYAPYGELRVHRLEYGSTDNTPDLPLLSAHGPGSYRLRAYTRGRDRYRDAVQENSGEQYRLQVWPAEPQESLIIRATDFCGYSLRLSTLHTPHVENIRPVPQQEPQGREAQIRAALQAQLLADRGTD
jgi:hypothetical protein